LLLELARRLTPGGFLLAVQRASKLSSPTGMVISMPLTLGWVRGYNADRMVLNL